MTLYRGQHLDSHTCHTNRSTAVQFSMNEFNGAGDDCVCVRVCVCQTWHCLQPLQFPWKRVERSWCEPQAIGHNYQELYSKTTSTKPPSFCMTTINACLTNITALLPQSRDCSYYVSRPIMTPPLLWLQKHTDIRTPYSAHSHSLWHQSRLVNVTCAWSWRLCGINPGMPVLRGFFDHEDGTRTFWAFWSRY